MKDNDLVIKIATGIILAFVVIGGLRACQQRMAMNAFSEQLQDINQNAKASMQRSSAEAAHRRDQKAAQAAQKQAIEAEARALPANHRCIGKDLFRRVENGWVQVTDGSARRICPS
jgi:hypothetical protein